MVIKLFAPSAMTNHVVFITSNIHFVGRKIVAEENLIRILEQCCLQCDGQQGEGEFRNDVNGIKKCDNNNGERCKKL